MAPLVEPLEGPELDRVITGLLNVTGVVHRLIDDAVGGRPPQGVEEGLALVGDVAARMRKMLVLFEEHHSDEELASITEFLALATVVIAEQGGWDDVFYPDAGPLADPEMPSW